MIPRLPLDRNPGPGLPSIPVGTKASVVASILAVCGVGACALALLYLWPSFTETYRKSAEGDMKGGLGTIRDAFARYRVERSENPPSLAALVESRHLAGLPLLWPKNSGVPHEPGNGTILLPDRVPTDSGKWAYAAGFAAPVFIDCTHTDTHGRAWAAY